MGFAFQQPKTRNCRHFELELALALRLIKTAALARRAGKSELSKLLYSQALLIRGSVLAGMKTLEPDDQAVFAPAAEELHDRLEEFQDLSLRQKTIAVHAPS